MTTSALVIGIVRDIRNTFEASLGMLNSAPLLQSLTIMEIKPDSGSRFKPAHCLVAIPLPKVCIVIELVFSPTAFAVPLGQELKSPLYHDLSGRQCGRIFRYLEDQAGAQNVYVEMDKPLTERHKVYPIDYDSVFSEITLNEASELDGSTMIPADKSLVTRSIVHEAPTKIAGTILDSGSWIINSCRLEVSFLHKRLTMQLPLADWLLRPQFSKYRWIQGLRMYRPVNDAVCNLVLDVVDGRNNQGYSRDLATFAKIGTFFGIHSVDIFYMAASVSEAWEEANLSFEHYYQEYAVDRKLIAA
ncbi:hypothetical protein AK830_g8769 [Neonectria ditissima]|uniref:Uncharacterized protein n=1 Tax=Neonectria ditissima TaxID=78410 RepID=A0A0N8H626_9HYPO|nr:hypothetical protein AK830_g8769 [Neonectria ditissima]